MSMNVVSSYFATLGVKVDRQSFLNADKALQNIKKTLEGFKKFKTDLTISPRIKFNELNLQRDIQKTFNRVGRLSEFKISRFNVDPSRLTSSLESAIRRAQHSAGNIRLKAVVDRSSVSQGTRALVRNHEAGNASNGLSGGVGGMIAAGRAGVAGIASYAGYNAIGQANQYVNDVQQRVIDTDQARMLVGQAVGGGQQQRQTGLDFYKDITNRYGIDARAGIRDFNSLMVNQRMAGATTAEAAKNWLLIQKRATFAHLDSDQQQRFVRQLIQIQGKGVVTQEDLSTIGDSDSGFKSTLIQAYAQKKGWTGNMQDWSAKYAADQKAGLVKWQDVIDALSLSARRYAKEIDESSNSLRADAQRTVNSKYWSDMERNSDTLTDTLKRRNDAEQKLIESAIPLQKMFTDLVEIPTIERMTSFTNGLADFATWANAIKTGTKTGDQAIDDVKKNAPELAKSYAENHPGIQGISWLWEHHPVLKRVKDGASSLYDQVMGPAPGTPGNRWVPDLKPYRELASQYGKSVNDFAIPNMINNPNLEPLRAPQFGSNPLIGLQADRGQELLQSMNQSYTNNSNNTSNIDAPINIAPGAIVVNGANQSPAEIMDGIRGELNDFAFRFQQNQLTETMSAYPTKTGR